MIGVLACMLAACGDDGAQPVDAGFDAPADANLMPMTLQDTGLCDDGPCAVINDGILAYKPQWELYSDGATKRRWLQLPPGTKIDTTDMDYWKFPVGTKVWKEFKLNGKRIETRYFEKRREGSGTTSWDMTTNRRAAQAETPATPLDNREIVDRY